MSKSGFFRNPLLIAFILLFITFALIFLALRVALPPPPPTTPTSTPKPPTITTTPSTTPTSTTSPTITLTPRPTWTLGPTSTATVSPTSTPTPTRTLYPTIKPATPLKYNDLYNLASWSPDKSNEFVERLKDYPNSLYPKEVSRLDPNYDAAFYYSAFAQREALLRYPQSVYAYQWKWDLVDSLAHLNDPQAGEYYTTLIANALTSGQVPITNLPEWFSQYEPSQTLTLYKLSTQPGYLSRQIIEIKSGGGGTYLWLLESPVTIEVFLINSYYDFAHAVEPYFTVGDLTGDGIEEIVIYHSPGIANTWVSLPRIYSVGSGRPPELSFDPDLPLDIGIEYQNKWEVVSGSNGKNQLQLTATVFPACPVEITRSYEWDGSKFTYRLYHYQINPKTGLVGYCEEIVKTIADVLGPEATIPLMETLLPNWPPPTNAQGKTYPADARDEWRYRLGINHALVGDQDEAKRYLTDIVANPTATDSRWIAPAQQFLDDYQMPGDLYRACQAAALCDPHRALEQMVNTSDINDPSLFLDYLQRSGVEVRSSGYFDFDNDGETERWLALRHHPEEKLEFWILARKTSFIKALYVDIVDSNTIAPYYHEPLQNPPIVQLEPRKGFILNRVPTTHAPYIIRVDVEFIPTTYTKDALNKAQKAWFAGDNPARVRDSLLEVEQSPNFNCRTYHFCDNFYYVLGLAHELAGDDRPAVDAYINAWWENSKGPFATMVRLRLVQKPYKTLTPTRTITPTTTQTPTGTPTPTATYTPTP